MLPTLAVLVWASLVALLLRALTWAKRRAKAYDAFLRARRLHDDRF